MTKLIGIGMAGFLGLFTSSNNLEFGAERSVDLGVATLQFSMQEDFSRDMPAIPLVENVDVRKIELLNKLEGGFLLQRWWDIKTPGLFGKNIGMLMMSVSLHAVPENRRMVVHDKPFDIFERFDLILSLNERFHQTYDEHNKQAENSGNEEFIYHGAPILNGHDGSYTTPFRDDVVNNTKWTSYSIATDLGAEMTVAHVVPLTPHSMLELRFTYSPDKSKISVLDFYESVKENRVSPTFNSFKIIFNSESSEAKNLIQGKWLAESTNDAMASHLKLLKEKFPPGEKIEYISPPERL